MAKILNQTFLVVFLSVLVACSSPTSSSSPSQDNDDTTEMWTISLEEIRELDGTCGFTECGYGAHSACSTTALMEVEETSPGYIRLDPYIAGLPLGLDFLGTIDSGGQINTVHEGFPDSTLIAGKINDTMGGQIYWKPNANCELTIDFSGTKN